MTYMYMDKIPLMTIKKTAYNGYIHTCDIITLYKLTYHDIWLDILICLKIITVLIYNCIYIYVCFQVLKTHIWRCTVGFLLFVLREIDVETSKLVQDKNNIGKSINYNYFSRYVLKIHLVT